MKKYTRETNKTCWFQIELTVQKDSSDRLEPFGLQQRNNLNNEQQSLSFLTIAGLILQ